jgi:hypothetical protein
MTEPTYELPHLLEQHLAAAAKACSGHPADVREALFQLRKTLAETLQVRDDQALHAELEVWKRRALAAEAVVERVRLYVTEQKGRSNGRYKATTP